MHEISAEIVLRPTRIGFLVSPTDLAAVRNVMRACTCLWGGSFNPIIPVFQRAPKEWRDGVLRAQRGTEVAKGHIRFFEPDVYVETKSGLLDEAGLSALRQDRFLHKQVISFDEFLKPEQDRSWADPAYGLNVTNVLAHIYRTEQKFLPRDKVDNLYIMPEPKHAISESMFGVYPTHSPVNYIEKAYKDVYRPETVAPSPDVWRRVFLRGSTTPLRVTRHGIDMERYWYHDVVIFVFDPYRATDLIDLWNLRLEPRPVLPVPVGWFQELSEDIHKILLDEYRPVAGNPNGVMHNAMIEFARSISRENADALLQYVKPDLPHGALVSKHWRNKIWIDHRNDFVHRDSRLKIAAKEHRIDLVIKDDRHLAATFESIKPDFPVSVSLGDHRWVNVLSVSSYRESKVATVMPFNTFDRSWPSLGSGIEPIPVTSEGWVFPQGHSNLGTHVRFLDNNDAIIGSLALHGITAALSEPGYIARQMLEHVDGLWGVSLFADLETLALLNDMAGSVRRKKNEHDSVEETFDLKSAPLHKWKGLVSRREKRRRLGQHGLEDFTKSNVIRLGLETDCTHCNAKNWHSLTALDYRVTCERCLKSYDFPQAAVGSKNQNFAYRVVGPFSVPDYGRGSYSALLALRFIERHKSGFTPMTFSTAMSLSFDGTKREVDFIAWRGDERLGNDFRRPPKLIIGEAKSFGRKDLITEADIAKLKSVAAKLPDSIVVISVLRGHFTAAEKRILERFVKWGRRANIHDEPTNPVILLTSHELTMNYLISATWKDLGGIHAQFGDYEHTRTLENLANATQQIYLGLPSYYEVRRAYWDGRAARRRVQPSASTSRAPA